MQIIYNVKTEQLKHHPGNGEFTSKMSRQEPRAANLRANFYMPNMISWNKVLTLGVLVYRIIEVDRGGKILNIIKLDSLLAANV